MRLRRKRHPEPPAPDQRIADRQAEAAEAREQTAEVGREIRARQPKIRSVSKTWHDLRAVNGFAETVTVALSRRREG